MQGSINCSTDLELGQSMQEDSLYMYDLKPSTRSPTTRAFADHLIEAPASLVQSISISFKSQRRGTSHRLHRLVLQAEALLVHRALCHCLSGSNVSTVHPAGIHRVC